MLPPRTMLKPPCAVLLRHCADLRDRTVPFGITAGRAKFVANPASKQKLDAIVSRSVHGRRHGLSSSGTSSNASPKAADLEQPDWSSQSGNITASS